MSRTDAERLADARLHLNTAVEYGRRTRLEQVHVDAICMRIAAGIEALNGLAASSRDELEVVIATLRDDIPHLVAVLDRALEGEQGPQTLG
ncbi:hypothetical protein QQX09_08105 [Demequina sp. SYSU T00192]|uniref:Uncharacterized protein n=1 Tax=Demequina litoralis TaxID=3051660 RepID=A0ABT8G9L7_9MICO|nr:hypothetical protein [Demequina sp. SYSU T00192]MDN4475818.1 hypothetical protein [Demequina sp. SYSU T00192]